MTVLTQSDDEAEEPMDYTPIGADLRAAAEAVVAVHARIINAVTPGHPDFLYSDGPKATSKDREKYSGLFSQWHSTTRALRDVLASTGNGGGA